MALMLKFASFMLVSLASFPALAFSLATLQDPAFLRYTLLTLPVSAALLMGFAEAVIIKSWFRLAPASLPVFIARYIAGRLLHLYLGIFFLWVVGMFVGKIVHEVDHPFIYWFTLIYCWFLFAYIAWYGTQKWLLISQPSLADLANVKLKIAALIGINYALLTAFIYADLFR